MGFLLWNQWRSRTISYLLHRRTIRLISGDSLIFSAPKVQSIQVLEQLRVSTKSYNDNLTDIIEISLLGVTSSRWTCVIEHFMSAACDRVPISKQYNEIREFLQDRSQFVHSKEHMANSELQQLAYRVSLGIFVKRLEIQTLFHGIRAIHGNHQEDLMKEYINLILAVQDENDIHEYVIKLLGTQLQLLWNLPAVLIAAVIPSWLTLFRLYLNEIDKEIPPLSGCCTCNQEGKLHIDLWDEKTGIQRNACISWCITFSSKYWFSRSERWPWQGALDIQ